MARISEVWGGHSANRNPMNGPQAAFAPAPSRLRCHREVRGFYLDTKKDGLLLAQPFLCWDGARVMRSFRCLVWREALSGERV